MDNFMFNDVNFGGEGDPGNIALIGDDLTVVPNIGQFADLYKDFTPDQIGDLYSRFAEQYKDQFTPEQLRQVEDALLTGGGMEDLIAQANRDVTDGGIMTGNPFGTNANLPKSFLDKLLSNKNLLQAGLGGLGALASYKSAKDAQKQAAGVSLKKNTPVTATRTAGKGTRYAADGGLMGLARGRYLDGHSDGMADRVPAQIDNRRPAALSDGEFVIPADVVSHLGNGNSNAGAKRLYKMMDDIRAARTGNPKQGKQINPDKFMPR